MYNAQEGFFLSSIPACAYFEVPISLLYLHFLPLSLRTHILFFSQQIKRKVDNQGKAEYFLTFVTPTTIPHECIKYNGNADFLCMNCISTGNYFLYYKAKWIKPLCKYKYSCKIYQVNNDVSKQSHSGKPDLHSFIPGGGSNHLAIGGPGD